MEHSSGTASCTIGASLGRRGFNMSIFKAVCAAGFAAALLGSAIPANAQDYEDYGWRRHHHREFGYGEPRRFGWDRGSEYGWRRHHDWDRGDRNRGDNGDWRRRRQGQDFGRSSGGPQPHFGGPMYDQADEN